VSLLYGHILLTLASKDKPAFTEDIARLIYAKLPDIDSDSPAFETITKHMIHGSCGTEIPHAPCTDGGSCTKHYPKSFCDDTTIEENGFVRYRCRNDGRSVTIHGKNIDNRWVVLYNRDLYVKYDAHINVECCAQKKVIKHVHKYMHKGPNQATIVVQDNIQNANNGRGPHHYKVVIRLNIT